MASLEIRLIKEDVDEDSSPEVLIEFYYREAASQESAFDPELASVSVVYSSEKNGLYDKTTDESDLDRSDVHDDKDRQILFDLANAFTKIDPQSFKPR
ncbi:MAG TPA: hypothetical protein VF682_09670 [Pseudomonas sp.]|jgi:hypothetical protein